MKIFYDAKETAEFLGVTVKTLANWRHEGVGPKFSKPRKKVYYSIDELNEWMKNEKQI